MNTFSNQVPQIIVKIGAKKKHKRNAKTHTLLRRVKIPLTI